jgi:hypothetical protein
MTQRNLFPWRPKPDKRIPNAEIKRRVREKLAGLEERQAKRAKRRLRATERSYANYWMRRTSREDYELR